MILSLASYLVGSVLGFALTFAYLADASQIVPIEWARTNLGHSIWAFTTCLLFFLATLGRLKTKLADTRHYQSVVQLDQLSDVWIHLFIGIGVIWTAIGMRSALVSTLSTPDTLANDASQVLGRLVDGGILLALSTTIVGAIGGYLMRLAKTITLGAALTDFYQRHDQQDWNVALDRLQSIERHLASIGHQRSTQDQYTGGINP